MNDIFYLITNKLQFIKIESSYNFAQKFRETYCVFSEKTNAFLGRIERKSRETILLLPICKTSNIT